MTGKVDLMLGKLYDCRSSSNGVATGSEFCPNASLIQKCMLNLT